MLYRFFSQQQVGAGIADANLASQFCALLSGPPRRCFSGLSTCLVFKAPFAIGLHTPVFLSSSGKTSLLYQFAYNCAIQGSSEVVFICKRQVLERKPPVLSQDVDADSEVFERVHMKYAEDHEDIQKYFAAFHLHENPPRAVIIDDFCEFFDDWKCRKLYGHLRSREIAIIKTLALCRDAVDYANKVSSKDGGCKLVVSDTHVGQGPRLLYMYQRWLPTILTIEALGSSFVLKIHRFGNSQEDTPTASARYTLAQESLKLEALHL